MRLNWNWFKRRPTQATHEQEPDTLRGRKKLVLFIHGIGGDAVSTWDKFPELIRADAEIAARYDVASAGYDTGLVGLHPSLAACARFLKTEIDNRYKDHSDIALIAHSQGGLIARRYIAERLNSHQPLRVSRLLTFATPHHGSGHATLLKRVLGASQQVEDLDPNSDFLRELSICPHREKLPARGAPAAGRRGGGLSRAAFAPQLSQANESNRFIYGARVLPFIGRDTEIGKLADFLDSPEQPFCWMVLYGSGGIGKSRLALELCLAIRDDWHAGFLEGEEPDWGRWQPLVPTLIVIDYAARDTKHTGKLLRALSGRGPADGTMRLSAPVRMLLTSGSARATGSTRL